MFPVYRMHYLWLPRVFPIACAFMTRVFGLRAYHQYVSEQGPVDVIHAHNTFYAGVLGASIRKRYHTPLFFTEHSSNHLRGRIFLPGQHAVMRDTLNNVDQRYAVSHRLSMYLQRYNSDIGVIDNTVNVDSFVPGPPISSEPFVFAAVGALHPIKRFDVLIQAFSKFKDQNTILRIGGEGPERPALERLIESLGLSSQVMLIGHLSREGVRDLFQNAHVVVSSSKVETFGITLIEAMACGLPVVATKSGGPEGIVTPAVGILAELDDLQDLVRCLEYVKENHVTFSAFAIRNYCEERFSEPAMVRKLESLYLSALNS